MTVKNNGGPAFPITVTDNSGQIAPTFTGMSLRDYFAIHASEKDIEAVRFGFSDMSRSEARYIYADEMLKAREEK
jgi:hypothetical protein